MLSPAVEPVCATPSRILFHNQATSTAAVFPKPVGATNVSGQAASTNPAWHE
jgi:hypothetical protein